MNVPVNGVFSGKGWVLDDEEVFGVIVFSGFGEMNEPVRMV